MFNLFNIAIFFFTVVGGLIPTSMPKTAPKAGTIIQEKVLSPTPVLNSSLPLMPVTDLNSGLPVKLNIPSINLSANIFSVSLTKEEIVDVPTHDVGWYQDGVKPGDVGNSVLDGHYINKDGSVGIFYTLNQLQTGQDIYTIDDKNQELHFKITEIELVNVADFPIEKVYGRTDKRMLNLITCAGSYDSSKKDYTQRLIIYSQLDQT